MNNESDFRLMFSAPPIPVPARPGAAGDGPAHASVSEDVRRLLAHVLAGESALYAITRDWRYDQGARTFIRLHALLDEQLAEIHGRLLKLSAHEQALGPPASTTPADRPARPPAEECAREAPRLRDLLNRHDALLGHLRAGQTMTTGRIRPGDTSELLTDLIAAHEKDAFLLRALLWELEHDTP